MKLFRSVVRWFRRRTTKPHQHTFILRGYGGAGWHMYVCTECGERTIE